ncbi:MAG: methyltransferase [Atopobiaceae bacterium]|nr:methyltransferase [Atopobiaceae bacterium]
MHGMHARLPKNFVLEERIERYAQVIELQPTHYAGRWADACRLLTGPDTAAFERIHVDLGCGKGAYVVQAAQANPHALFVAIDAEPICVAYTAQHVMEAGLRNVVVVPGLGSQLASMFGPRELSAITLNFPTPFPRKKEADKRLTILERLMEYREVLADGASVTLKTDSLPFWQFSRRQFELAGYRMLWLTDDARGERPDSIATEYEQRLTAQGATVYAIEATPDPAPKHVEQTESLSLADYLPEDLSTLSYVPHGMQGLVTNRRNHEARLRGKRR